MIAASGTVVLLFLSNIFMTIAWYGHLKYKDRALWIVILVSWGIALIEYCLQVPANRLGHSYFSAPQLKAMQEAITFVVFGIFSIFYLQEKLHWHDYLAFGLIFLGVLISLCGAHWSKLFP